MGVEIISNDIEETVMEPDFEKSDYYGKMRLEKSDD